LARTGFADWQNPTGVCVDSRGCGSDGGGSSGSSGGYSPGINWGHMTSRNMAMVKGECGDKPLCFLVQGTIGLVCGAVTDVPYYAVAGVGYGLYYGVVGLGKGAVGIGKGAAYAGRAIGHGIAYPFTRTSKPASAPAPAVAPPPAAPSAEECSAALTSQSKALDEERAESEKFNAAIVRTQLDQGLAKAGEAFNEKLWEKPEWETAKALEQTGASEPGKRGLLEGSDFKERVAAAKGKAEQAKDFAQAVRGFHRDTRKCLAAGGPSDVFLKCMDAVNELYGKLLGDAPGAKKVEAAKDAYQKYVASALQKSSGLIEEAARCTGR
jgi:hypothetical protein